MTKTIRGPIYLSDLRENPNILSEQRAQYEKRYGPKCCECHEPMSKGQKHLHPEEYQYVRRKVNGKLKELPIHEDCLYDNLGKLVEQHPIVSAGIRRG